MDKDWVTAYRGAIDDCVGRYRGMAEQHGCNDLLEFLAEFNHGVPIVKLSRWLGYVQGVLIERKITTVEAERNWTRPKFRPLDFA